MAYIGMRTNPWAFDRICWWASRHLGSRWILGRRMIWKDLPFRDGEGWVRQRNMGTIGE